MSVLAHHAAFAISVAALGGTSLRVATRWAPAGPDRILAAAALGCSLAVVEALGLGLLGLGGSAPALTAASLVTWAVAARTLPRPGLGPGGELAVWWRGLGPTARIATGAGAAAGAWWVVWTFLNPAIGFDSSLYHLVEVVLWVQGGTPGSVESVSYGFPVGNYPLANEVLTAWGSGSAHSFVPPTLWAPASLALAGLAAWTGLRHLEIGPVTAGLATASVLSVPSVATQVTEPQTDLPALAWLLVAGALAAGARSRPELLAPALLAAGLAVGTKTTTVLLAIAVLVLGWRAARGRIQAPAVALAGAATAVVAGLWYARNLVTHGSPLWPFRPGPFGDPVPAWLAVVDTTFLERPIATISGLRLREFVARLGATPLLLGAAFVAPLVSRRREVVIAAAATAVSLFAWMNAPATGLPAAPEVWTPQGWPESATRYLLPTLPAAALTLSLAARDGWARKAAMGVLAAVTAANIVVLIGRGDPFLPPAQLALAAAAGALIVFASERMRPTSSRTVNRDGGRSPVLRTAAGLLVLVAVAALFSLAATGFVERHSRVSESSALGTDVVRWLAPHAGFRDGEDPVAVLSRGMIAPLAGDRLQHPLELVPARESCQGVLARARRGWLVASEPAFANGFLGLGKVRAATCLRGERPIFSGRNYDVYRLP